MRKEEMREGGEGGGRGGRREGREEGGRERGRGKKREGRKAGITVLTTSFPQGGKEGRERSVSNL